ncbi:MAG: RNA polymerase subunit sigma-24 [Lentisphaerae bacterium RIFOXYB12_FULL_65_16]|nr:MAG: RNA polymerase subunit sigma-24 [Lentisphaerae bacterium RIFOXYA12_64_32]OGV92323.1 MAG: RNA polymerase subunit sigma-24 [Lentisphaerae bacterium RIFOXYB12_FULL_65_16]
MPRQFATTHWTVVLTAGRDDADATRAHEALEQLCRTYWYPLYAFVRRQGHSAADAQDLTQAFFARFIAKHCLDAVDRSKGKFRSFLLASLSHFLANEWDKASAKKRGGDQVFIELDAHTAEDRYALEPTDNMTAERIFDRRWALTLLDTVFTRLRAEFAASGKAPLFDALKDTLTGEKTTARYAEIAATLGMTEGAVKVAVHRLRQRYRDLLRAEVANTVASTSDVDEELRHLFAALSG